MTRGPYLQHAADGVTVVWYTDSATQGEVRWLVDDDMPGEAPSSAGLATRHEAVIQSLVFGAHYSYRVYSQRGLLSAVGGAVDFSFRAPDPDVLRLVVFGDSGLGSPGQYAIAKAIGEEAAAPLLPHFPFYAVLGNHDCEVQAGMPFFDVFTLPRNGPAGLVPGFSYWLERAGVQMIAHDTNQSAATLRDHSVPWHTEVARQTATFRFVFQHHAMYSSGPAYQEYPAVVLRSLLAPVYTATGVDVVFNGHDHLYERTKPINGVVYVTTGAGGAVLYPRYYTNAFTAAFVNDRHSYTYLEVSGRTLLMRQTDGEGHGIDAMAITKPVTSSDALRAFAGAGSPPRGWDDPAFDDSSWPEAKRVGFASAVRARRAFDVSHPADVSEALLRVRGARDFVARLNGVAVARGGGPDEPEGAPPSLELSLLSSPPR
jgi:hypothetical protein